MKKLIICAALASMPAYADVIEPNHIGTLPTADVVFLGEVHDNPSHHDNQARAIAAIGPAALVFEMLTDVQASAIPSPLPTQAELREILDWDNSGWPDFAMYFPLFAAAPDAAVFGEKDFQQLAVIRTMVRDLDMEIEIIGGAIAREADGLAMSSRNVRLSPADRAAAPVLARALDQAAEMAPSGVTASRLRSHVRAMLEAEPRAQVQSVDIRDAVTLDTIVGPLTRPAVILLAVKFGQVFLIDNRVLHPAKEST